VGALPEKREVLVSTALLPSIGLTRCAEGAGTGEYVVEVGAAGAREAEVLNKLEVFELSLV